jgi:ABC-type taurine transport system substrate-binding protein
MPSRSDLKTSIKSLPVWAEVSKEYANAIPNAARNGEFAKCLKDAMEAGRAGVDVYKQCAEKAGIASKLSGVWTD